MSDTRICTWCGQDNEIPKRETAKCCEAWLLARPDPNTMTPDQRELELNHIGVVECDFTLIHQRIEALAGDSIWTHMMADRDYLVMRVRREHTPESWAAECEGKRNPTVIGHINEQRETPLQVIPVIHP